MNEIERLYKEWLSLQPLKPEYQQRLDQKFMLEFNYNSNHIEGNTLTYGQTEMLLLFGKAVDDSTMKDLEEMKAHSVALKMVQTEAKSKEYPLTETFIRELHKTLLREDYVQYRQLPDGNNTSFTIHAGIYKTRPNSVITVTGERFEYASPEETPALMKDLVDWYNEEEKKNELTPIELASVFHYRYIRIHPFEDGNGRIARLIFNYILIRHNYPMIVVESKNKDAYLTALNRCDSLVGPIPSDGGHAPMEKLDPFIKYMEQCLVHALTICIKAAKGENINESNDWRKRLKMKYIDKINKPELTDDIKNHIIDEYMSILNSINSDLSDFYSIFHSFKWLPAPAQCYTNDDAKPFSSELHYSKEGLTNTYYEHIYIHLYFEQFEYKISISLEKGNGTSSIIYYKEFNYNETLSKQDITDTINVIGQSFETFLEKDDKLLDKENEPIGGYNELPF